MAKSAVKEEFIIPAGGIADFYMEDSEIAALEKEEGQKAYGEKGIANFEQVASRMASYGRYGDDRVAHVETGELIVPKALIDNNPKLKESIFSHLEEMGIEDPERYVVGSGENSINPETGLPEFFFKALSKIAKGVSKVIKGVVKVVKKVAPIILPIALSFTPLGAVYGAALGSGIGTLMNGGSIKDALKSALIAGGAGALFKGFTGKGSFGENVSGALSNPAGRLGQTIAGAKSTFTGGGFTGEGNLFGSYTAPGSEVISPVEQVAQTTSVTDVPTVSEVRPPTEFESLSQELLESLAPGTPIPKPVVDPVVTEPSMFETAGDYLFRGGQSADDIASAATSAQSTAVQDYLASAKAAGLDTTSSAVQSAAIKAGEAAAKSVQPGFLTKFGPSAALGTAGLAAAGFFSEPEQEDDPLLASMGPTGAELLAQNPETYGVQGSQVTSSTGPYYTPTRFGYNPVSGLYNLDPFGNVQQAADGGEIFPRRNGGIMPNEGIPNKDSVRAMLMPGEFVMTTDAVKGLGNGDIRQGINSMYDMMRGLESKGRAMA
jgi:hypothetical protein